MDKEQTPEEILSEYRATEWILIPGSILPPGYEGRKGMKLHEAIRRRYAAILEYQNGWNRLKETEQVLESDIEKLELQRKQILDQAELTIRQEWTPKHYDDEYLAGQEPFEKMKGYEALIGGFIKWIDRHFLPHVRPNESDPNSKLPELYDFIVERIGDDLERWKGSLIFDGDLALQSKIYLGVLKNTFRLWDRLGYVPEFKFTQDGVEVVNLQPPEKPSPKKASSRLVSPEYERVVKDVVLRGPTLGGRWNSASEVYCEIELLLGRNGNGCYKYMQDHHQRFGFKKMPKIDDLYKWASAES